MKKLLSFSPIFIIIFVGLVIYANALSSSFQFDDREFIINNERIRDIKDIQQLWKSPADPLRFVSFTTFALNYHFHQLEVFGYHLVNIVIHLINAIFLWWFVQLIFATPKLKDEEIARHKRLIAFFTALLFLTHPIQTQAVAYISQRFASLATLFYVGAICFYVQGRIGRSLKVFWFACALIFSSLSMLTKQIAFTLPFSLLMFEYFFISIKGYKGALRGRTKAVFGFIILIFILIIPALYSFDFSRHILHTGYSKSYGGGDIITTYGYLLTQFRVVVTYLKVLIFPYTQNLIYDFPLSKSFFEIKTILSFALLLVIFCLAVLNFSRNILFSFGICWFFLTLSVESSIIPIPHVIFEHRCYLPFIGMSMAICMFMFQVIRNKRRFVAVMTIIILVCSYLTYQRNKVWQDPISLWSDVTKKSPMASRSIYNLGAAYLEKGEYQLAAENFKKSLEVNSTSTSSANSYGNLGLIDRLQGNRRAALEYFNKAIAANPAFTIAYINRGDIYNSFKNYKLAMADYNKAIEMSPKFAEVYNNRGNIHKLYGRYMEALDDYNQAIKINPHLVQGYNNRGVVYKVIGKYPLALQDYNKALTLDPGYRTAYLNRSVLYNLTGKPQKAIEDIYKAKAIKKSVDQRYIEFLRKGMDL